MKNTIRLLGMILLALSLAGCPDYSNNGRSLQSEAGYLEVEPISFSLQKQGSEPYALTSSTARVFYSFFPAAQNPVGKPLFVFLNGGPGCATTTNLFSMNTAPYTLDRERTKGARYATNPNSWDELGNLLYIDAPNTGFSYNVVPGASSFDVRLLEFNAQNFNPFIDSANVIRVLLRFLEAHPQIRANQVVLVGESYSGTRVSTMLNLLLFYPGYASGDKVYKDAALAAEVQRHFDRVYPADAVNGIYAPATVARQFGRQILIQPEISGPYQAAADGDLFEAPGSVIDTIAAATGTTYSRCDPSDTACNKETNALVFAEEVAGRDRYIYRKPVGWTDELEAYAMLGLLDASVLSAVLEDDVRTIALMRPAARTNGYRYLIDQFGVNYLDPGVLPPRQAQTLRLLKASRARVNAALAGAPGGSLHEVLGMLPAYDDYLSGTNFLVWFAFMLNNATIRGYPVSPDSSPLYGQMFLENIALVKTFLTDSEFDLVIYSPGYPVALSMYTSIVKAVDVKRGKELDGKTGSFRVTYQPNSLNGVPTPAYVDIFYPYYATAGHAIAAEQPEKILTDVTRWMQ